MGVLAKIKTFSGERDEKAPFSHGKTVQYLDIFYRVETRSGDEIVFRIPSLCYAERANLRPKRHPSTGFDPSRNSASRRRAFRVLALSLPLLLLALLEGVLRVAGYGYPTGFALKHSANGKTVFIDNQRFAQRFFPPGLARSPHPFRFAREKPATTTRIFVFGESAAMGDPEPAFGFARILELLLKHRYPGTNFEVINTGVTAINSHVIREIARDVAPRQGDIWIIYMGNNEVIGPFGAGTVFGAQTPRLGFVRASIALKKLRLGQLLDDMRYRLAGRSRPQSWAGMEMFLDQQIAADDPRLATVYQHFETNLRDIVAIGTKAGAKIVLSTVTGNLKDCPPFASLHSRGFASTNDWTKLYEAAAARQQSNDFAGALQDLQRAAALDAGYAELQFRIAQCQLALGRTNEARDSFLRARDLDALRFRADSRLNEIIRKTAQEKTLKLVDAAESLNRASPHGITGSDYLLEHVHFNLAGNYRVAELLSDSVVDLLADQPKIAGQPSVAECARLLAFTAWDELQLTEEMARRLSQPPFTHQLDHQASLARLDAKRTELQKQWQGPGHDLALQTYREALAAAPQDWLLHENFAGLLQALGQPKEAEQHWRAVIDLMPHYPAAYYSLANILDAQGRGAEALDYFHRALRAKPDSIEARNGIGLALANLGRKDEALREYRKALAQKPDFAEARVNLGQLFAERGQEEEAKAQYALALRYNSNSAAAHVNLGKLLAKQKQYPEAIGHYREALRINPDSAIAHYNLGNALTSMGDPQAGHHFLEAVKHNPGFAEARYNLGLHLSNQNRTEDALAQFAEVVRLKPEFVEGRFNYGVALARSRRFPEAIEQFEAVLRLDPTNAGAKQLLERARAAVGK
jgi:tetratricopeptide (TPR) repeat protein